MLRSTASKVMWVGRATVFMVGFAVILALVVGVVSRATAHTGSAGLFHLGHSNPVAALSTLAGNVANGVLNVSNTSTANTATAVGATNKSAVSPAVRATNSGGGPALGLRVASDKAPMTVSSGAAKVNNLDADKVDGEEAGSFADGVDGKATDADELDGKDSSEFAAASNVKVGRLELNEPPGSSGSAPSNSGTVLETSAFEIRGVCTNHPVSSSPEPSLQVVAKQATRAITYTTEGTGGSGEVFNHSAGQSLEFAHILVTGDFANPDTFNTYGSYLADAQGGFLEGQGTIALQGSKCIFSATGLGQ